MVVEFQLNFTLDLVRFQIFLFVDCLSDVLKSPSEEMCVLSRSFRTLTCCVRFFNLQSMF